MTLAVCVKYPLKEIIALAPPSTSLPVAVVLASDSRWTWEYNDGRREYEDGAAKLFKVDDRTLAVYAGHSELGESCLGELRHRLSTGLADRDRLGRENASQTFQDVYGKYCLLNKLEGRNKPQLYFLLGTCSRNGQTELCYFTCNDEFTPQPYDEYEAIGTKQAVYSFHTYFQQLVNKSVKRNWTTRSRHPQLPIAQMCPVPIRPEEVAMMIAASIQKVIDSSEYLSVGGRVQCAIVTPKEATLLSQRFTTDPTNEGPGFTRATPRPGELESYTETIGCYDPRELE